MTQDKRYIPTTEVTKLIRQDLKKVFGSAVKFSVRSDKYSGGSSIRVSWTDGPTREMVERICKGYAGGGFDGMTDYKYRYDSFLDGERVRFSVDFIFCDREISESLRRRAASSDRLDPDSLDDAPTINRAAQKRCAVAYFDMFNRNFTGPRAVADVEQAEAERSAVYPSEERRSGFPGANPAEDVQRFDNADDAARAARSGQRINIMDLVPKRSQ